jgi:hypothetical protein
MQVITVEDLIKELQKFPPTLELYGYDGGDQERPISVYRNSSADEDPRDLDGETWDHVVIDVDH